MSQWLRRLAIVAVIVVLGVAGAAALVWFSGGSGEPSGELVTPTLSVPDTTAPAVTSTAGAGASTTSSPGGDPVADTVLYEIDQGRSAVRFIIDEELRGEPTRVVGTTDQVAAQILVDFVDPSASQLGPVRINARTLATDNEFRDRAIRGQILDSVDDAFEFIEFVPTAIAGFPAQLTMGTDVTIEVTGDLTIRTVTRPVTFAVSLRVGRDAVTGSGTAEVLRADFDLSIPSVPNVANVSEMVTLEIDFVALPVG